MQMMHKQIASQLVVGREIRKNDNRHQFAEIIENSIRERERMTEKKWHQFETIQKGNIKALLGLQGQVRKALESWNQISSIRRSTLPVV